MTAENDAVEICRSVMAAVPAGVAVMTLRDPEGVRRGMTISSLTVVSYEPPSVLMCIGGAASSRPALVPGQTFCANVLGPDQTALSVGFAWAEADPFAVFESSPSADGTPVLAGTTAHLLCTVEKVVEHHGTYVVMAGVDGGSLDGDEALVYWKKSYFGEMTPVAPDVRGRW